MITPELEQSRHTSAEKRKRRSGACRPTDKDPRRSRPRVPTGVIQVCVLRVRSTLAGVATLLLGCTGIAAFFLGCAGIAALLGCTGIAALLGRTGIAAFLGCTGITALLRQLARIACAASFLGCTGITAFLLCRARIGLAGLRRTWAFRRASGICHRRRHRCRHRQQGSCRQCLFLVHNLMPPNDISGSFRRAPSRPRAGPRIGRSALAWPIN